MDQYLRGEDGYRYIERDAQGREIVLYRGLERAPRNGCQVYLTIDMGLQTIVENELDAAMREYTPAKATIILMRPQTGEILAMANRPNFDLNLRAEAKPEEMKNRAIIDMMEPGSTFKIVTAAAALNEQQSHARLDDLLRKRRLERRWPAVARSRPQRLWRPERAGHPRPFEQHRRGQDGRACWANKSFTNTSGVSVLAIAPASNCQARFAGWFIAPRSWSKISITRIPMGQEVGVTPLQMLLAMATVANGGKLIQPRIVKSVIDDKGKALGVLKPTVVRQVISPQTASQIALALRGVVSKRGTAAEAAVPGFTMSGKTGTAQKAAPGGGYEKNKYVVSFSGFLPSENPAFVGLVVLDDAHTKDPNLNYGGTVAGPIFSRVAEQAARYLDLEPHEEIGTPATAGRVALTNAHR